MKLYFMPKTHLDKWSVGLAAVFLLLYVLLQAFYSLLHRNPVPNPGPPSPLILMTVVADYASGILSFAFGLTCIAKSEERAVLVFSVVVAAFLVFIFLIGEFLVPH